MPRTLRFPPAFATLLALALAACSSAPSAPAAKPALPADQPATDAPGVAPVDAAHLKTQLDRYIAGFGRNRGDARKFNGYVHVVQGDRVLYSRAFGLSDRERNRTADADTNFRIGSVTKQFTAAAILLLEADGKLALTDPIKKYIPEYPAVGADITIHQLLSHTAGLLSYTSIESVMDSRDKARTPTELMQSFWDKPLQFAPGTSWQYSNSGYVVLGVIIERISGSSYGDFMKQRVFGPAGMTRTEVGDASTMANRAEGYEVKNDQIQPARAIDMSNAYAAGAVRSTAADLTRWHRVLMGTTVLSEASKKKLFTPVKQDYAYGWMIKDKDGKRMIGHGGGIDGFITDFRRVPAMDLVVVTWSNFEAHNAAKVAGAAVTAAFGGTPEPVVEPTAAKANPELARRCAGTYDLTAGARAKISKAAPPAVVATIAKVTVRVHGDKLGVKPIGQPELDMQLGTDGAYHNADASIKFHCKPGAGTAPAASVAIEQGPFKLDYQRSAASTK